MPFNPRTPHVMFVIQSVHTFRGIHIYSTANGLLVQVSHGWCNGWTWIEPDQSCHTPNVERVYATHTHTYTACVQYVRVRRRRRWCRPRPKSKRIYPHKTKRDIAWNLEVCNKLKFRNELFFLLCLKGNKQRKEGFEKGHQKWYGKPCETNKRTSKKKSIEGKSE